MNTTIRDYVKNIAITVLSIVMNIGLCAGQQLSSINMDKIKKEISDSTSSFFYPTLLERLNSLDSSLSDMEYQYLYYGYAFQASYSPYGDPKDAGEFKDLIKAKSLKQAAVLGRKVLREDPVNLRTIYQLMYLYLELEMEDTAKAHARNYYKLLKVILTSGDGRSVKNAYVVIKVADEYDLLNEMGLRMTRQALSGNTDILTLKIRDKKKAKRFKKFKKMYFNVYLSLNYMSDLFRKEND